MHMSPNRRRRHQSADRYLLTGSSSRVQPVPSYRPRYSPSRNEVKDEIEQLDMLLDDLISEVNKPAPPSLTSNRTWHHRSIGHQETMGSVAALPAGSFSDALVSETPLPQLEPGYISTARIRSKRQPIKLYRIEHGNDCIMPFSAYHPTLPISGSIEHNKIDSYSLRKMSLRSPSASRMNLSSWRPPVTSEVERFHHDIRGSHYPSGGIPVGYETDTGPMSKVISTGARRHVLDGYETDSGLLTRLQLSRTLPIHHQPPDSQQIPFIPETIVISSPTGGTAMTLADYSAGEEDLTIPVPVMRQHDQMRTIPVSILPSPAMLDQCGSIHSGHRFYNNDNAASQVAANRMISDWQLDRPTTGHHQQQQQWDPYGSNSSTTRELITGGHVNATITQGKANLDHRSPAASIPEALQPPETPSVSIAVQNMVSNVEPRILDEPHRRPPPPVQHESVENAIVSYCPSNVKDNSSFWYKPKISREEAIRILKGRNPGSFIIRDSVGYPGAYGLALKVAKPPPHVQIRPGGDISQELVRHYLIEPTPNGVRLKGCTNEATYASLASLVYHHSLEPIALPCKVVLPDRDLEEIDENSSEVQSKTSNTAVITDKISGQALLKRGAACHVVYLGRVDADNQTGKQACFRAIDRIFAWSSECSSANGGGNTNLTPILVHFKVNMQGITLTDPHRILFVQRNYPIDCVHCATVDADRSRYWTKKCADIEMLDKARCFAFLSKKISPPYDNECHVFVEYDPKQPASAIVNFIMKVMLDR